MNKSILIKGSIIMGLFLLIILAAVGCSLITADATEPTLSNGDDVYLTMDDLTITNSQLWEVMKNVDGLSFLIDFVDRILLEEELKDVTLEEINKEITLLTYLTSNEELIAEIQADPELNQEKIDTFVNNLVILGFDPNNADDLRAFTEVGIAKTKIAKEYMLNATGDNVYTLTDTELESYYDSLTYGDACAIEIRFESDAEASLVFDHFNLVPNFNSGIGKYTDQLIDIKDVPSDEFILDENTDQLTEDEVFEQFVLIYNYMNPWKIQIPVDISQDDYCNDFSDIATYSYSEMIDERNPEDPVIGLASYIFRTLSLDIEDEDALRYSYSPQEVGDAHLYIYKVAQDSSVAFEDLTVEALLELKSDIIDVILTGEVIDRIIDTIYEDVEFDIYDPYLGLKYEFEIGTKFDNDGSKTLVAKIGDVEITADELFAFMENRIGTFYSIELAKTELVLTSSAYAIMFGDDHDYLNSNNDTMIANRDKLRTMKSTFAGDGYSSYNLSSSEYTWHEFMYLAFNVKTESELIEQLFIMQDLQTRTIFPTLDYASVEDYILNVSEEYFSLNAEHLLIYVDFDLDFAPDDFTEFLEGLSTQEMIDYEAIKVDFDSLLFSKVNDDMTFDEIVDEYEDSLMDDLSNEWAKFKQFGFKIMTQNLTSQESLNNVNSQDFDSTFADSLKRIYDAYVIEKSNSIEDITEYLDTQITESSFGIHLILATEGSAFELFSAAYDPLDDTITGVFTVGSENDSDIPNEQQILIYNGIKFATIGGDLSLDILPPVVYQSIDLYYGEMFATYFTQAGLSIVTINEMYASNVSFASDNVASLESLQSILDVLYDINFLEGYVVID